MEADWNETTRITASSTTAFAFDPTQELLWTGNENGRLTSFFGPDLQKYTSYRGHGNNARRGTGAIAPVHQILFCDRGVISVSLKSVHLASRRGVAQWHIAHDTMTDLRCMSFTSRDANEIVVAGCQVQMYRIDVEKGTIVEIISPQTPVPYTLMRLAGHVICAAAHDGSIHLLDPRTLSVTHSWKAYAGTVNDMDARGDYLLTCGWAQMQYQGLALERLVRVYNLKTQQPAPPVPFQSGAAYVRIHPKLSSTCIVISQSGAIHSVDVTNHDAPVMRYANVYDVQFTGLELMPSGRGFAIADGTNQIVLWGSPSKLQFCEFAAPTEFADQLPSHIRSLDWSTDLPLNTIGMPYYRESLLSAWPNNMIHNVGAVAPAVEPLGPQFRMFEHGYVGPNPRRTRRYEVEDSRSRQKVSNALAAPRFLSERPRENESEHPQDRRLSEDVVKIFGSMHVEGKEVSDVKFFYRNVEIKYSRFGVEDFDFRYYNNTQFAGLETHIAHSYANPLLQLLRFTATTRNLALQHTAQDCQKEDCLLCELGFLIDMLEKAKGPNCQASNFLRTLSRQPDAQGQNILEDRTVGIELTTMVQNLNRYLLRKMENDVLGTTSTLQSFHEAFATTGLDQTKCLQCGYESRTDQVWYSHDLNYQSQKVAKHVARPPRQYFSQLLKNAIEKSSSHRGWCLKCNGYKPMSSTRAIHNLPDVLMLNAVATGPDAQQLWSTPKFLPREIGIITNNGRFFCYEGQDLQHHVQRGQYKIRVYELVGVVAEVKMGDAEKPHLVAAIDVGPTGHGSRPSDDWHLFNDFLVHEVPADEALQFDAKWKLPSVLTYQLKSRAHDFNDTWKSSIDTSILYRSPMQPSNRPDYTFRALTPDEPLPNSTTHCAIDAEFVRLFREEIDVGADGTRIMTRPARSALARVSVLRGSDGHDQELPFIDDYIAIDEHIDDYLTQYSGLHAGDLTRNRSRFALVPRKDVYKKLWVLLNLGVRFIGHGLSSDFRIINIHVPEGQVVDTQDLFSLGARGRRKLSLRFLAWILLGEDIQQDVEAGHDSIEDARTALKLWKKYREFAEAGVLEQKMDEVFHRGRATEFKVPSAEGWKGRVGNGGGGGGVGGSTPNVSAPNTPLKQNVRLATAGSGRMEFGSPHKRSDFGSLG